MNKNAIYALARILTYILQKKIKMILKAFIMSKWSYCPWVWVCIRARLRTMTSVIFMKGVLDFSLTIGSQHLKSFYVSLCNT